MKRKRILALALCALLLLTGCTFLKKPEQETNDSSQILAELEAVKQQLNDTKSELAAMVKNDPLGSAQTPVVTETPEPVEVEREVPVDSVFGVNCTVNGESSVQLDGATQVRAVAKQFSGYEFDHWEIGDEPDYESGPDATFICSEATVIVAHYHLRRVVTFINCHMNFMNSEGKAGGKNLTEFDFEDDYTNPVTNESCKGGSIDFFITAEVPQGKEVDYWLINGVKYQAPNNAYKIRVKGQTEATVYEVVLRKKGRTPLG